MKKDYLLFVDETKPTLHSTSFCFAGIIVERTYYEKTLIKDVTNLKISHFGKSDIIFHFSDMKKNRGNFSILQNTTLRNKFWKDYVALIANASFDILGIYFDDNKMSYLQHGKQKNNYN
ncbi:MAG: DUF3800 domain-containing protein [Lachnospiraceae bacterium]|nr:DUF3800 domain-containing protein [Lachnospiraceae bacterium]